MAKRSTTYGGKLRGHFICGRITRAEYIACLRGHKQVAGMHLYDCWPGLFGRRRFSRRLEVPHGHR